MPCDLSCADGEVCVNVGANHTATCRSLASYAWHIKTAELDARVDIFIAFVAELIARVFENPAYVRFVGFKDALLQGLNATVVQVSGGVEVNITLPGFSATADASGSLGAGRRLLTDSTGTDQVMSNAQSQSPYPTTDSGSSSSSSSSSTGGGGTTQKGGASQVGTLLSVVLVFVAMLV